MHFVLPEASPLPSSYDLVACRVCNCGFADSAACEADYAEYYRNFSKYEESAIATGGGEQPFDRARLDAMAVYLAIQVAKDGRIADIGAGNGGLLKSMRSLGYGQLTGFDPSPVCVDHMREAGFAAEVWALPSNAPATMAIGGGYDLIVLSHVLEHVFDVRGTLNSVLGLLAPEGKLYIEVPDPDRYDASRFPPFYFFDTEHINHIGEISLRYLAKTLGLSIIEIGQKELALPNGADYPALYTVFTPEQLVSSAVGIKGSIRPSLARYVDESHRQLDKLRVRILALVDKHKFIAIWGVGSLSQRLMSEGWFPREKIVAMVDRDNKKAGLSFMGMRIQSPEAGLSTLPDGTVVLCIAAIAANEIARDYQSMQLPYPYFNIIDPVR
jgi:2-polyprenyl-3-methyl-5-hydroxy-6-metoxy-1,4-benzoquinol methylase